MNIRTSEKLEINCILIDDQRERKPRSATIFGFTENGGPKDFMVDSLLKAQVIAVCECNKCQVIGMVITDVKCLSDSKLLQIFPFHSGTWFIGLSSLAVWNYN